MTRFPAFMIILLGACAPAVSPTSPPATFRLPEDVVVIAGTDGRRIAVDEVLRRIGAADFVLLGELHDNPVHHAIRGRLITTFEAQRPAIVFEQFAETAEPLSIPATGEPRESWLDRNGFDRQSWRWPLHAPIVAAALESGAPIWGSGMSRERLRSVVGAGESAAPAHLRELMERIPLDGAGRAILDRELVASHCGQLPDNMVSGMRAAQIVRDAAMANALRRAGTNRPAWLIAGNGHVRKDIAVPRLLRAIDAGKSALSIGFLERTPTDEEPDEASRRIFDIVVVTPHIQRPDPCAGSPLR